MTAYLVINGILFLVVGLRALLKPVDAVAEPFDLKVEGVDGLNYLRSGAGGVAIACGGVILAGGFVPALAFSGVVLCVTVLGGLVAGRLFSWAVDGQPGAFPIFSGLLEALGLGFGVFWLLQ